MTDQDTILNLIKHLPLDVDEIAAELRNGTTFAPEADDLTAYDYNALGATTEKEMHIAALAFNVGYARATNCAALADKAEAIRRILDIDDADTLHNLNSILKKL